MVSAFRGKDGDNAEERGRGHQGKGGAREEDCRYRKGRPSEEGSPGQQERRRVEEVSLDEVGGCGQEPNADENRV